MSDTITAVIESIPEPKQGTGAKGPWTKYALKANGEYYSTFRKEVFEPAYQLEGKPAEIEYEQSGQFKNLLGVKAATGAAAENAVGAPPVRAKTAGDDQRAINARESVRAAVQATSHTISKDMTPRDVSERITLIAGGLLIFLNRETGVLGDTDDFPF